MECVVHYVIKDSRYSQLKSLSDNQYGRLITAKAIRQDSTELNFHAEQCATIPDGGFDKNIHGVHLEPCYKKFTAIIARSRKRKSNDEAVLNRLKRTGNEGNPSTSGIFPKVCFVCKKQRRTIKKKIYFAYTITTENAAAKIKEAAALKEDNELLIQITGVDLIAKELMTHKECYLDYIRCISEKAEAVSDNKDERSGFGDFDKVKEFIGEGIINRSQAVSMTALHKIYGTGFGQENERVYRNKLKARIITEFGNSLKFLKIDGVTPEVVVSAEALDATTICRDKDAILKEAAEYIREDILEYASENHNTTWPPTVESLKEMEKDSPSSLHDFLTHVLKSKDHKCSDKVKRLVSSYGHDLIHGVTRGKVVTLKHFLLGVGLHNMTGLKLPIKVLSHLGHSIDYDLVCEIETAEAEAAQMLYEKGTVNPAEESTSYPPILTFWWADNFNQTLESTTGHGVINSTHLVQFSEPKDSATAASGFTLNIPRSKGRSLPSSDSNLPSIIIDKKKEPKVKCVPVPDHTALQIQEVVDSFHIFQFIWMLSRRLSSSDQIVPSMSGWSVKIQEIFGETSQKTTLTYLPPIDSPITEFSTMAKVFDVIQEQARKNSMPYANITLDVGAAINAYKVLWNHPERFKNVVIHLGDFHFMKEVFGVLGKVISGSGFEDVIFQSGLCSSGSLRGVVSGSHYNRCWTVHSHLAETLERLLFERFLTTIDEIPKVLEERPPCRDVKEYFEKLVEDESIHELLEQYMKFEEDVRSGIHGKTSQFWLLYYIDIMRNQHLIHFAVQTNNFLLRLHGLKRVLPLMFALNKQNYARYGSLYVNSLENLEETHPGCLELIKHKGISVQGQNKYPCRTAIDQRGEQTINRDAKVAGGIKYFASDSNSILKWTLNRAAQAKNTEALYDLAEIKRSDDIYKHNRPSQIIINI